MTFRAFFFSTVALASMASVLVVASRGFAQGQTPAAPPSKPTYGTFNFTTQIGAFKLIDGEGTVDVNFTGTLLVSQLKGTVTPAGNLKKEYESKDKQTWHGTGKVTIKGKFRAIQWFGTKMTGKWVGNGRARIYGEFDEKLDTGWYWYNDPTKKVAWSMYGIELSVPEFQQGGGGVPVERKTGGGSGKGG